MKKKFDLSLYLVLDANLCMTPDGMVETTRKAIDGGCTIVQLRAPEWKKKKVLEAARKLKALLEPEGIPLIINDHIDVALLSKADGLHVGLIRPITSASARYTRLKPRKTQAQQSGLRG